MEQCDSSEEESSRVLEQQQRNDEQQCPSYAAELTETSVWTTAGNETECMGWSDQQVSLAAGRWCHPGQSSRLPLVTSLHAVRRCHCIVVSQLWCEGSTMLLLCIGNCAVEWCYVGGCRYLPILGPTLTLWCLPITSKWSMNREQTFCSPKNLWVAHLYSSVNVRSECSCEGVFVRV